MSMKEPFHPHPNLSDDVNRNIIQSEIDGGVYLSNIAAGQSIFVQTEDALYRIHKISEKAFVLQGHPRYCPTATPASIHGSTWGGSMLKLGFIGRSMFMEYRIPSQPFPITTTRICEIAGSEEEIRRRMSDREFA